MDSKETNIFTALVISTGIISIILLYFTATIIRAHRKNLYLSRKQALLEITILEKECARIAADLHDDLGPILSVIKFKILDAALGGEGAATQIHEAAGELDELLFRIRRIAGNLMPTALERKGLRTSIEEYVADLERTGRMRVELHLEDCPRLDASRNIHIFRIIQEVAYNSLRHARATRLRISVKAKDHLLKITIQDNGIGFDYEKFLAQNKGIGLHSIKNRVMLLQGSLTVESKVQKGTAFLIHLPLP